MCPRVGKYFIEIQAFFISITFISNARLKLAKNQANAKQHPEAELLLFENSSVSSFMLSSKINMRYSNKYATNKFDCFDEIMWLVIMKLMLKMKYGSHRYDINRTRPRRGNKCSKYKMCLIIMMVMCNKQHLSNIWSYIHKKIKQHWGWVGKKALLIKRKQALLLIINFIIVEKSIWICKKVNL